MYHKLSGLNNKLFLTVLEVMKPKIRVPARSFSGENTDSWCADGFQKRTVLASGKLLYFPACQRTAYFFFRSCLNFHFQVSSGICSLYQDNYQNKISFSLPFSPPEVTSRTRRKQVIFIQIMLLY